MSDVWCMYHIGVLCYFFDISELYIVVYFCLLLEDNNLTDGQKEVIKQSVVQSNPQCSVSV